MNNIFGGSAIDIIKITKESKWYEFDVTKGVAISNRVSKAAFTLGAINKDGMMVHFASSESESRMPYLKVISGGNEVKIYPEVDSTIHSGTLEATSFGFDNTIEIC